MDYTRSTFRDEIRRRMEWRRRVREMLAEDAATVADIQQAADDMLRDALRPASQ